MKILVTGFPGTGKSRIAAELKSRGHKAYDPQAMRSYMHVQNRKTGQNIHQPDKVPEGWYDDVGAFNWDLTKILQLLDTSGDIFICSMAHNQKSILNNFDFVFFLTLSTEVLTSRLKNRPGCTIGKTDSELNDILRLRGHFERRLQENGAIPINSDQTPQEIINFILKTMNTDL